MGHDMTMWIGVVLMAIAVVWFVVAATLDVTCRYRGRSEGLTVTIRRRRSRHRADPSSNSFHDMKVTGGNGAGRFPLGVWELDAPIRKVAAGGSGGSGRRGPVVGGGSGGGGGGASVNGNNSGAGGAGAVGRIVITSYGA